VNFTFNEEQGLLAESARSFFQQYDSAAVRAAFASEAGYDAALWRRLIDELGWTGIAVPEACGGLGLGMVELCIVQLEMGRALYASPFFSSICLAANAVLAAGTEAQHRQWLPELVTGNRVAALACTGSQGRPGCEGVEAVLTPAGTGFTLSGEASFVVFGHVADLLVIAARAPGSSGVDGISLIALPSDTAGIDVKKLEALDVTRPYTRLRFDAVAVPAEAVLGEPGAAAPALLRTLALGNIALAAEQVGGAERCLTFTTEYAKQRHQFGRPIGSFQAIKHRLADMMVLVEASKSAVYYAGCTAAEAPEQLAEAAAVAKAFCADAFFKCAGDAIQLHGGIGFTWEHDAHLFFKRARASANLLGDPIHQREQVAQLLFSGALPLTAAR
jgi:alkylation response protein AidB-like acyl-CoA dehydrogenase